MNASGGERRPLRKIFRAEKVKYHKGRFSNSRLFAVREMRLQGGTCLGYNIFAQYAGADGKKGRYTAAEALCYSDAEVHFRFSSLPWDDELEGGERESEFFIILKSVRFK